MDAEPFDTELFIGEVETRRCIWDVECPDYKNRVLNKSAWQEIVDIFAEENSTKEQKTALGNTLQEKWKHVRDNYAREVKKQKTLKSGSGASKSIPYIFFQRLQFLQPTLTNKTVTDNLENSSQLEDETELQDLQLPSDEPRTSAVHRNVNSNKKFKMNPVDEQFLNILNKSVALREQRPTEVPKEDDDKLFCLSLYTELQKVPGHGRLRTKIQLLEVLQRAQEFYNPSSILPAPPSYHSYQGPSGIAPPQAYNQFDQSGPICKETNTRKFLRAHRLQQPISSSSEHTFFPISASRSSPFANRQ